MRETPPVLETMRQALRGGCLSPEELAALHDGRMQKEQSLLSRAHLDGCAECKAEWHLLEEFVDASPNAKERHDVEAILARMKPAHDRRRGEPRSWWSWLALPALPKLAGALAGVALVAALAVDWRDPTPLQAPGDQWRSSAKVTVLTQGDVKSLQAEWRWTGIEGASMYEVSLSEVDGSLLWQGRTTATSMAAPTAARRFFLPRKTLVLRVKGLDSQGRVRAESEPARLRLLP